MSMAHQCHAEQPIYISVRQEGLMTQVAADTQSTVFIVDDEPEVRTGIMRALQARGHNVKIFASGAELLSESMPGHAACLILDLVMPGMSGLQVQAALLERGDSIPIIFLTSYGDVPSAAQAMRNGAIDFLEKPVRAADLDKLVLHALCSDRAAKADREKAGLIRRRVKALSKRQYEILSLVVQGHLNKKIAARLGIREDTVKRHRHKMMQKMQVGSVQDLVRMVERIDFGSLAP